MKQYLIDTNCAISYVTDRNMLQQSIMMRYFEEATEYRCELICLSTVVYEFVYVMEKVYSVDTIIIQKMINDLSRTPGVSIKGDYSLRPVLSLWPHKITDYGDAIIAAYALEYSIPILTFDQKFRKELLKSNILVEAPTKG